MAYFTFENKKVFYEVAGEGKPVLFLAGNTASSRMFGMIIGMYQKNYRTILLDYPGHGKSERLDKFEPDFWYYNSKVCIALLDELGIEKVSVVGSSGGAIVGINMALEYPERISYLVADSFEGESLTDEVVKNIVEDRERNKKSIGGRLFWRMLHGRGWKKIVDADTKVIVDFHKAGRLFYHKPIAELKTPTLLVGSKEDGLCGDLESIYGEMQSKNKSLEIHLYEKGSHPAIISNAEDFYKLVTERV